MSERNEKWIITANAAGSGAFMDPPGLATHRYGVEGRYRNNGNVFASMSLESAANDESVPAGIRERARRMLADSPLVMSEQWVQQVYGYFKNCYTPDDAPEDRNVSNCVIDRTNTLPPERHLAYLHVKQFFPDHEPRLDLIESGGWYGTAECVKCGTRVQYEARYDAWAKFGESPACPKGGNHEPKPKEG